MYDWSHITFLWKLKTSIFDPNDLKSRYNAILPSLLCAIAKALLLQFSKHLFWHPLWPHVAKVVKPTQTCSLHCWYLVTPGMVQKQRLWKCFTCLTCSALMVHVSAPENRSVKTTQHDILPAWLLETDYYSEIWAFSKIQRLFQLKQCGAPLPFSAHRHLWYCFHGMWNPQWFLLSRLISVFVWHLHLLHVCCTARNALSYTGAGRRCWDLRGIECVRNAYKWSFLKSLKQGTEYYSPVWWT